MKLMKWSSVALILAAGLGTACGFERRSSTIAPSPTGTPAGGSGATTSFVGTWSSQASPSDLPPEVRSCTSFQWTVSSQTATTISGGFTATCAAGVTITGSGTGELLGTTLAISMTGSASLGTVCSFTLTGNGYYENDQITIAFAGNSCYGPFSGVETLRRGSLPGPPPSPTPAPPPPPPPAPAIPCAFDNGPQIVDCVAETFPERLVAGISLQERQANMMFLRDRIIEGGLCGGLDLGWNLKRGGPEISIDFLVWRRNGQQTGIDIGFDYDNTATELRLQWHESTFPFYTPYPAPNCG